MKEKFYGLTKPQDSIWLTESFYETDSISNIGGSLLFQQKVNFVLLEKAIQLFVEKNDAIRLSFDIIDGTPYQFVNNYFSAFVPKFSVNSLDDLKILEKKWIHTNIDLSDSCLYQFRLVEFPDGSGGFNVTLHHLICDAWSMSLLINQITSFYHDLLIEKDIDENSFPSYIDYIQTEENYLKSEKFKKDSLFWEETFDSNPSLVSFSCKNSPAISQKANRFIYPLENSDEINSYCKKHNITAFSFLMAIFSLYLYKTSNISDIILGTPILNRNGIKEKNTIGMFVNTLPMKIHIDNDESFLSLVKQISKDQFSLFRHHKYPYSEILKYVREKYNFSNNLYDTIISYQNARDNSQTFSEKYTTNWDFCGSISNSLDIHIYDMDDSGILKLYYDYQTEKFTEKEVKNINYRIIYMINQVLSQDNILVNQIELLDSYEKNRLENFNDNNVLNIYSIRININEKRWKCW